MIHIGFAYGTLDIRGVEDADLLPACCRWDARSRSYRAPAIDYAEIVMALVRAKVPYTDHARAYTEMTEQIHARRTPRPYQAEAIEAWQKAKGRGVVVLPTGAGKTYVALMAIEAKGRSTLVVAPTLDLVRQWYDNLRNAFRVPVGIVGGGEYDVQDLTVITYDSAYQHMEHLGSRFGLIVFDECHHLPGDAYGMASKLCIAPYRLGLTATPERGDGRHEELVELIGPFVYRKQINELSGDFLAEYTTERILVDLSPEEWAEYQEERAIYRDFVHRSGISFKRKGGWQEFIAKSSRSAEGRRAMQAYRRQRALAFAAPSKLEYVEMLLHQHRRDRAILFTQDNATAYSIARRFLVPVITHQTKIKERSAILQGLADGTFNALSTSKVLNEGVDVPDANVAIIISGSGSVREHVQRLGRILRKKGDKTATLYELVSNDTAEAYTSERRRDHVAYR
ncbi:MAG: DEAD/DEAH box helicase family protein [Bradymonadia bacterium]